MEVQYIGFMHSFHKSPSRLKVHLIAALRRILLATCLACPGSLFAESPFHERFSGHISELVFPHFLGLTPHTPVDASIRYPGFMKPTCANHQARLGYQAVHPELSDLYGSFESRISWMTFGAWLGNARLFVDQNADNSTHAYAATAAAWLLPQNLPARASAVIEYADSIVLDRYYYPAANSVEREHKSQAFATTITGDWIGPGMPFIRVGGADQFDRLLLDEERTFTLRTWNNLNDSMETESLTVKHRIEAKNRAREYRFAVGYLFPRIGDLFTAIEIEANLLQTVRDTFLDTSYVDRSWSDEYIQDRVYRTRGWVEEFGRDTLRAVVRLDQGVRKTIGPITLLGGFEGTIAVDLFRLETDPHFHEGFVPAYKRCHHTETSAAFPLAIAWRRGDCAVLAGWRPGLASNHFHFDPDHAPRSVLREHTSHWRVDRLHAAVQYAVNSNVLLTAEPHFYGHRVALALEVMVTW